MENNLFSTLSSKEEEFLDKLGELFAEYNICLVDDEFLSNEENEKSPEECILDDVIFLNYNDVIDYIFDEIVEE